MINEEKKEIEGIYIRKSKKGGIYFFSPNGRYIYFGNSKHITAVIAGEKDFCVMEKNKAQNGVQNETGEIYIGKSKNVTELITG